MKLVDMIKVVVEAFEWRRPKPRASDLRPERRDAGTRPSGIPPRPRVQSRLTPATPHTTLRPKRTLRRGPHECDVPVREREPRSSARVSAGWAVASHVQRVRSPVMRRRRCRCRCDLPWRRRQTRVRASTWGLRCAAMPVSTGAGLPTTDRAKRCRHCEGMKLQYSANGFFLSYSFPNHSEYTTQSILPIIEKLRITAEDE